MNNTMEIEYKEKLSSYRKRFASLYEGVKEGWSDPNDDREMDLISKQMLELKRTYANNGVAIAQYDLSVFYRDNHDMANSYYWIKKAAENKYHQALSDLIYFRAYEYLRAKEIDYDLHEQFLWTKFSAEAELVCEDLKKAGKGFFSHCLSECYLNGVGTDVNLDEALRWCTITLDLNPNAYGAAETLLKIQRQIMKKDLNSGSNIEKYIEMLTKSAELDDEEAIIELAGLYEKGILIERDYGKAFSLYSEPFKNAYGKYKCGYFYENGLDVKVDIVKAAGAYFESANLGCRDAMQKLSEFYRDGRVFVKDTYAADYWEEKYKNSDNSKG